MWSIGLGLFTAIMLIALGIVIGIYISSQIENHINKRTK
jgi:uncharacterized membrane protein|tara:strand:- start:1683 stop:1799 length:117 start_codon:yes stop_codon:yes gene_type:complete